MFSCCRHSHVYYYEVLTFNLLIPLLAHYFLLMCFHFLSFFLSFVLFHFHCYQFAVNAAANFPQDFCSVVLKIFNPFFIYCPSPPHSSPLSLHPSFLSSTYLFTPLFPTNAPLLLPNVQEGAAEEPHQGQ